MTYYYEASLAGLQLEGRTDAGIIQADGLIRARSLAEGEVMTKNPTAVILSLEVRQVKEEELCAPWD